jgi:signal transduction histidine kinase
MADGGGTPEVYALRSLHDLITTVHSGEDLEEVLQTAAQGVVDVLGFQVAVVDVLDAYGYVEALAVAGDPDACRSLKGRRVSLKDLEDEFAIAEDWGLLKFVPHDRLPPDAEYSWVPDFEFAGGPDAWHPMDALYAILQGPTGEMLGMLSVDLPVDRRRPDALTRQVLEMYAVQAGLAIHHAQERERLHERVRLASATRTIIETASRELDLGRILDASFQPLSDGFAADRLLIRVFDVDARGVDGTLLSETGATYPKNLLTHLPTFLATVPDSPLRGSTAELLDLGERVARCCWPENRTMVVADLGDSSAGLLSSDERDLVLELVRALGSDSLMLVPLGTGPECLGYTLMLRSKDAAEWSEAEDEAALEVGREIGRAVHRARLYQAERRLVTQLQELDRFRGEMIATITHELKNPLTSIGGHVELLADDGVAPVSVDAIARNVRRLQQLVEDLLLLSSIRDPQRPFEPAEVELSALVREVCDLLDVQASRRDLVIDIGGVDPDVWVVAERDELARMLTNVVSNAVKYTGDGGSVRLGLAAKDGLAVFTCADTGIGIAEEDLATLFDEFDRSSNPAAHAVPGTGLGLAIVRRIVDRHGGTIEVDSVLGRGSTFRVSLPARCA